MTSAELVRTLVARLASRGVEASGPTLRATLRADVGSHDIEALRTVRAIAAGQEPPLAVLSTLGEGGMGIVQLGTQRSLHRDVALKTLRPDDQPDGAVARLVREAIITGALEHPNIVPVYDLAVGNQGVPVLVMKRVEGSTWTARLRDEANARADSAAPDLLEWNLRTLMSVCQAVHFAHSRGVVHRDLKPDNVMVGSFGEVYVLDWGIAARIDTAQSQRGNTILGTPAYMAPEMLLCEAITPRTDVYLLGAILFEILTGRAPHDIAGGLSHVVGSVLGPPLELPESAPAELVRLVRSCMDQDPSSRPESAERVRHDLAEFLGHRGSADLAARTGARLAELETALATAVSDVESVQRLYGEVTFGFRAALESWPENEAARIGLAQATRALVRFELAQGTARAASARLADLVEPDDALRAEVEEATRRAAEEARRIAALQADLDPRTGRRTRQRLISVTCGLWTLQPLAQHFGLLGKSAETHLAGAAMAVFFAVVVIICAIVLRRTILRSRINRQLVGVGLFVLFAQAVAYGGAAMLGLPASTTQIFLLFVWFSIAGILGATVEPRLMVAAVAFLAAFGLAAFEPRVRLLAESAANFVLTLAALWTWRSRAIAKPDGDTNPAGVL